MRAPVQRAGNMRAPGQRAGNMRAPGQQAGNTWAPGQRAGNTWAPGQRAGNMRASRQRAHGGSWSNTNFATIEFVYSMYAFGVDFKNEFTKSFDRKLNLNIL